MNRGLILIISISLVVSISLFGCSPSPGGEEAVAVKELTVTFEPEKCTYDGPKTIR
jgi:hypothetical protein